MCDDAFYQTTMPHCNFLNQSKVRDYIYNYNVYKGIYNNKVDDHTSITTIW